MTTDMMHGDTDRDGMLDLQEAIYGLQGAVPDAHLDYDFDGISNSSEVKWHLHPLVNHTAQEAQKRYRYEVWPSEGQCYEFLVSGVDLVPTGVSEDLSLDSDGYNEIRVHLTRDLVPGESGWSGVRTACVRALWRDRHHAQ